MGVCLARCGVDTSRIPGVTHCWYGHSKSQGHTFRAEELAKGLARHPALLPGVQKIQKIDPKEFKDTLAGKGGIIFFKDYWQRTTKKGEKESFRNRSGDHIDLWNGYRMTDWDSWAKIHIRIGSYGIHPFLDNVSDYEKSKAVWCWRVL